MDKILVRRALLHVRLAPVDLHEFEEKAFDPLAKLALESRILKIALAPNLADLIGFEATTSAQLLLEARRTPEHEFVQIPGKEPFAAGLSSLVPGIAHRAFDERRATVVRPRNLGFPCQANPLLLVDDGKVAPFETAAGPRFQLDFGERSRSSMSIEQCIHPGFCFADDCPFGLELR